MVSQQTSDMYVNSVRSSSELHIDSQVGGREQYAEHVLYNSCDVISLTVMCCVCRETLAEPANQQKPLLVYMYQESAAHYTQAPIDIDRAECKKLNKLYCTSSEIDICLNVRLTMD